MKKLWVLSSVLLLAACGGGDKLSKSAVQKAVNASAKFHSVFLPQFLPLAQYPSVAP